jgi:hypothetical protein
MFKKILKVLVIACFLFTLGMTTTGLAADEQPTPPVFATDGDVVKNDYTLYMSTTGSSLSVAWDHSEDYEQGVVEYELLLYSFERDVFEALATTSSDTLTFTLARAGHYVVYIRACYVDKTTCTENDVCYSEWVESIDPTYARVDGVAKGWWIYGYLAGPGDITIE